MPHHAGEGPKLPVERMCPRRGTRQTSPQPTCGNRANAFVWWASTTSTDRMFFATSTTTREIHAAALPQPEDCNARAALAAKVWPSRSPRAGRPLAAPRLLWDQAATIAGPHFLRWPQATLGCSYHQAMGSSDLERRDAGDPEPRSSGQAASPRQLARIVGVAVAGALAVVTLGLVLALWGLGLTGKINQSTSEVLDLVKLGFALVAGVGGTVGLVLAYQRHLIAVEAGQRESAKEAREEAKLFNERFGTAAAQLASEQYAVKLGGLRDGHARR